MVHLVNRDAGGTQSRGAACGGRVRVGHSIHDASDTAGDERVAAGRRSAMMGAGFECYKRGRSARRAPSASQRGGLGMGVTAAGVVSPSNL